LLYRIFVIFFIVIVAPNVSAQTLGNIYNDTLYKTIKNSNNYDGVFNLLIYSSIRENEREIILAPDYEIKINDVSIAKINQKFSSLAMQGSILSSSKGELKYLKITLPNGQYKISAYKNTFFDSSLKFEFDLIVRKDKEIFVIAREDYPKLVNEIPDQLGELVTKPSEEFNQKNYQQLLKVTEANASLFFQAEISLRNKKLEEDRLVELDMQRYRDQAKKEFEEKEQRNEKLEADRKAAAVIRQLENEVAKRQAEEEENKKFEFEDDKTCKAVGAKVDTQPYISCRVSLIIARKEQKDRAIAMKTLEDKIELLQKQLARQEAERSIEADRAESQRKEEITILQRQLTEGRRAQERTQRLDQAERAFAAAAALSQPQQIVPQTNSSPFQSYNINGKHLNCNTIGNLTNCR
jgi:hypothetical protein